MILSDSIQSLFNTLTWEITISLATDDTVSYGSDGLWTRVIQSVGSGITETEVDEWFGRGSAGSSESRDYGSDEVVGAGLEGRKVG